MKKFLVSTNDGDNLFIVNADDEEDATSKVSDYIDDYEGSELGTNKLIASNLVYEEIDEINPQDQKELQSI